MNEPVALFTRASKKPLAVRRATLIERVRINGATEAEIDFLMTNAAGEQGGGHIGKRVELNAMTSDEFVAFVERKLREHGAEKVVPDKETLADACAAFTRGRKAKAAFGDEFERIKNETVDVPADLAEPARDWLADHPTANGTTRSRRLPPRSSNPSRRMTPVPLNEKVFDDQIRFVIKSELKARLYREAGRRHMSAADLLRLFIEEGLGLVKTEDRPAASKAHKTGPNLQNPVREPQRSPRTAAAKAGKTTGRRARNRRPEPAGDRTGALIAPAPAPSPRAKSGRARSDATA